MNLTPMSPDRYLLRIRSLKLAMRECRNALHKAKTDTESAHLAKRLMQFQDALTALRESPVVVNSEGRQR